MDNQAATPAPAETQSCHRGGDQRLALIVVGALTVLAVGAGIAIDRNWLSFAALAPLLYLLPCALMMWMCARGAHK